MIRLGKMGLNFSSSLVKLLFFQVFQFIIKGFVDSTLFSSSPSKNRNQDAFLKVADADLCCVPTGPILSFDQDGHLLLKLHEIVPFYTTLFENLPRAFSFRSRKCSGPCLRSETKP